MRAGRGPRADFGLTRPCKGNASGKSDCEFYSIRKQRPPYHHIAPRVSTDALTRPYLGLVRWSASWQRSQFRRWGPWPLTPAAQRLASRICNLPRWAVSDFLYATTRGAGYVSGFDLGATAGQAQLATTTAISASYLQLESVDLALRVVGTGAELYLAGLNDSRLDGVNLARQCLTGADNRLPAQGASHVGALDGLGCAKQGLYAGPRTVAQGQIRYRAIAARHQDQFARAIDRGGNSGAIVRKSLHAIDRRLHQRRHLGRRIGASRYRSPGPYSWRLMDPYRSG